MTSDGLESRTERREGVIMQAEVRHDSAGTFTTRVRNISPHGARLDTSCSLPVGTPVELTLRGMGAVKGTVIWLRGGTFGVQFDETIDPDRTKPHIAVKEPLDRAKLSSEYRRPGLRSSG